MRLKLAPSSVDKQAICHSCSDFYRTGVGRAGVYCAASICLDKLNNEGEVDVFNATRTVMHNRPQLVENLVSTHLNVTLLPKLFGIVNLAG